MLGIANQHESFPADSSRLSMATAALITVVLAICIALVILSSAKMALLAIGFAPFIIYTYARRPGIFLFFSTMPYMATQLVFRELEVISAGSLSININRVYMAILTVALTARLLANRKNNQTLFPTSFKIHFSFLIWSLFSYFLLLTPGGTVVMFRLAACFIAAVFAYQFSPQPRERNWILLTIGITSISAGLSTIIDLGSNDPTPTLMFRSTGMFGGAVATAVIAFAGLPVFVEMFVLGKGLRPKYFGLIGFGSLAICLALTLTRTALLGVLLFFIFLAISLRRELPRLHGKRFVMALVPLIILLATFMLDQGSQLATRFADVQELAAGGELESSIGSGRIGIWGAFLDALQEAHPLNLLFGHGLTSSWYVAQRIGLPYESHNSYLAIVFDMGIIGLIFYLSLLLGTMRNLYDASIANRTDRIRGFIWLSYYMAFCLSTILFNGYVYAVGQRWLTYLGIGACLGMLRQRSTDSGADPQPSAVKEILS